MGNQQGGTFETSHSGGVVPAMMPVVVDVAQDELSLTQHSADKNGVPRKVNKKGKGTLASVADGMKRVLSMESLTSEKSSGGKARSSTKAVDNKATNANTPPSAAAGVGARRLSRTLSLETEDTASTSEKSRSGKSRPSSTKKADNNNNKAANADSPTLAGGEARRLSRSLSMDCLSMETVDTASTPEKSRSGKVRSSPTKKADNANKAANIYASYTPSEGGNGQRIKRVLTVNSFGSYDNLLSEFTDGMSETLLVDASSLKGTTFAGRTKKGYAASNPSKPNQDAFWMFHDPATSSLVVAVFDGHGQFGHDVSAYCKTYFQDHLPSHPTFATDLHRAIHGTIEGLERDMLAAPHIDTIFSGTTLTLAVVRGTVLTVANVGDSRAVAGVQLRTPKKGGAASAASGPFHVLQLTEDHKPELVEEKKRIVSSGGRVDMVNGCGRVYLATEDVPGLAMSRSLGDYVAHDAGVSSTPDIHDYDLTGLPGIASGRSGDFLRVSLLVATDGVFDVMSNEDAVATALQHWEEPGAAVDDILAVTDATWRTKWNVIDDTSVCVVNIECL